MRERPGLELKLPGGDPSRERRSLVVSIVLHVVVLAGLSSLVAVPVLNLIRGRLPARPVAEHVTFLEQEAAKSARTRDSVRPVPAKKPPDTDRSKIPDVPPPGPVAPPTPPPVVIPTGVTPMTTPPAPGDSVRDRRIVGRGGIPGLSPGVVDPRLLGIGLPSETERNKAFAGDGLNMEAVVHAWAQTYWDSIARVQMNAGKNPMDWTTERNGKKYGMDPQFIYFGKFKLPTILLALLPINVMGNPSAKERNRQLESMRWEISYQAMRAGNDEEFREAVKALRARKEAEHQAMLAKRGGK